MVYIYYNMYNFREFVYTLLRPCIYIYISTYKIYIYIYSVLQYSYTLPYLPVCVYYTVVEVYTTASIQHIYRHERITFAMFPICLSKGPPRALV